MPKPSLFRVSLTLGMDIVTAKGATLEDAFLALPMPEKVTTKGVFTIKQGEKSAIVPMYAVRHLRRFAANKTTRALFAKRMSILLK